MSGITVRYKLELKTNGRRAKTRVIVPVGEAAPPPDVVEPALPPGPTRAARMLALAHYVERKIEAGELEGYADAARVLGITRQRMTQVMNMILVEPTVQEQVLLGRGAKNERQLRGARATIGDADQ